MRAAPRIAILTAMVLAVATVVAGCSTTSGTVVSVTIIHVPSPAEVNAGDTIDLDVTVLTTGGAGNAVSWSSSDDATATVDAGGVVTGVAPGPVTITAVSTADNSKSDSVALTVLNPGNRRPTADAGLDATVVADPGGSVTLDGSGSSDPDGDPLSYAWSLTSAPSGSAAALSGAATAGPNFTADLAGDYTLLLEVSDGALSNNDTVTIHAECPAPIQVTTAIGSNATWGVNVANCADYVVTKMIQVQADLTIQPGTHVQFASAAGLWTTPAAAGSIHAVGTAAKPILFDGTDPTPGYWKALQFATGNPNNELTYAVVDGGGTPLTGLSGGSIVLTNSGSVKITHSVVRNGNHFGIEDVSDSEAALQGFADNRFEGNGDAPIDLPASAVGGLDTASAYDPVGTPNGKHYISVRRGIITAMDSSWAALDVPLRFTDRLEVQNAHALTIAPGSELVFTNSLAYILIQDGSSLTAQGTTADPIVLHGSNAGQGTWGGLRFLNASNSTLDHVMISGGGSDGRGDVVIQGTGLTVTLTNSTLSDSGGFGAYIYAGSATSPADPTSVAANNTFSNNVDGPFGP